MRFPSLLSSPISLRWGWLNWPANLRRATTVVFLAFANWLFLAPAATFRDVHVFLAQQATNLGNEEIQREAEACIDCRTGVKNVLRFVMAGPALF